MHVIGCLILWIFGALFLLVAKKVFNIKQVDYRQFPITVATVIGTHDYFGKRWMVKFTDTYGTQVLGADDTIAESTFHPEKYSLPKRGTMEYVYYWPNSHRSKFSINGVPLLYEFHFCNEAFYTLQKEKAKRNRMIFRIVGILMFLAGAAILVWGLS